MPLFPYRGSEIKYAAGLAVSLGATLTLSRSHSVARLWWLTELDSPLLRAAERRCCRVSARRL